MNSIPLTDQGSSAHHGHHSIYTRPTRISDHIFLYCHCTSRSAYITWPLTDDL